jgi:hypothetical protein
MEINTLCELIRRDFVALWLFGGQGGIKENKPLLLISYR